MAQKLTLNKTAYYQANDFISDVSNNSLYFFYGNHDPSITTPQDVLDTESTSIDSYSNMIAGKKIKPQDILPAIRNVTYTSNTVYTMYDDTMELLNDNFYVIVNEGSYFHCYKVLDNNRGAPSTVQPAFAQISGANSAIYQTSDGYRWKYMFSVDSATQLKFATSDYFPLVANATVISQAVDGAVDIVVVDGQGQNYDNYVTGTFTTSNLRVGGNTYVYEIANNSAVLSNGFYTGCIIYISSGTGVGQYSSIADYYSNTTGKYVVLATPFSIAPLNGSEYQVYPEVIIDGTGTGKTNAVARALVNAYSQNSIYRVEILNRGQGYDYVTNVYAVANSSVSVLPAILRGINSPPLGHGSDPVAELMSNSVLISVATSNSEGNTIPISNFFQQIGIMKNPVFDNVAVQLANSSGTFLTGETVYKIKPLQIAANATTYITSANLDCSTADFSGLQSGDVLYLTNSDQSAHQLATVNVVLSNNNLTIGSNGFFACSEVLVYLARTGATASFTSANTTHVILGNVSTSQGSPLVQNDQFIGEQTGAWGQVNTTIMNGITKTFDTFTQLYKYVGTVGSGTFQENEYIVQSNASLNLSASALYHSMGDNGDGYEYILASKQNEDFLAGGSNTFIGNTSGAVFQLINKYTPEIAAGSGYILFIENVNPITRSANTTETFTFHLTF